MTTLNPTNNLERALVEMLPILAERMADAIDTDYECYGERGSFSASYTEGSIEVYVHFEADYEAHVEDSTYWNPGWADLIYSNVRKVECIEAWDNDSDEEVSEEFEAVFAEEMFNAANEHCIDIRHKYRHIA